MTEKLKKCPFCGGKAKWEEIGAQPDIFCVKCQKCWAKSIFVYHDQKTLAIEAWNMRSNP